MNKELKSLTWKYFIQQKVVEITSALLIIVGIIFIPYLLGHNIGDNSDTMCGDLYRMEGDCGIVAQWLEGIFYMIIGGIASLGVFIGGCGIFYALESWINSNWKKAEKRAKKEIKNR